MVPQEFNRIRRLHVMRCPETPTERVHSLRFLPFEHLENWLLATGEYHLQSGKNPKFVSEMPYGLSDRLP
jgi:hypothetical protein